MNNYMMFGRTLIVQVIPTEKVHEKMFLGANRVFRAVPHKMLSKQRHNKVRTHEEQEKRIAKLIKQEGKKRKQLAAMGIEYDFKGYAGERKARPVRKVL